MIRRAEAQRDLEQRTDSEHAALLALLGLEVPLRFDVGDQHGLHGVLEIELAHRHRLPQLGRAARLLGITRSQLYSRMQKYGLAAG